MKRKLLLFLVFALTVSSLLACSNSGSSSGNTSVVPSNKEGSPEKDKITLKVGIWGENDSRQKIIEAHVTKFTEKNPHIKVEFTRIPLADYTQKLSIMSASKTMPDVIWSHVSLVERFSANDQLMDLSAIKDDPEYNFDDHIPSSFEGLQKDGKIYAIPFLNPPKLLFFNKTLFEEKGIKNPLELLAEDKWNYDEFLEVSKALTDPAKGQYGIKLFSVNGWTAWEEAFIDTLWAFGGEFLNRDFDKFMMNSPEAEQALTYIEDLIFKYEVHPKPGDQLSFEGGKLAMQRQNYAYVNTARAITNFEWDIAPMPKGAVEDAPVATGVVGYSVTKGTKYPEEALEFVKFMTSEETMMEFAHMYVPTRLSVLESDALSKGYDSPTPEGIRAALVNPMKTNTRPQSAHKNFAEIQLEVQGQLDLIYTRDQTVKEMLNHLDKTIPPILAK